MWRDPDSYKYLMAALLALFGAIVHATNQLRVARANDEPFTFVDWIILFPTALFAGVVFGLMAQLTTDNAIHLMLAVSTGAFLGLAGLNKVADRVLAALTKER